DERAEARLERRRAAGLHFEVSVFSFFANSGSTFIALAQPASYALSTYALVAAASNRIAWMPAFSWRAVSSFAYCVQKPFIASSASACLSRNAFCAGVSRW